MMKLPGVPPTAQGSLDKTPFSHLLVYAAEKRLTGTLLLFLAESAEGDESVIQFKEGEVCAVRTAQPPADIEQCSGLPETTPFAFYEGIELLASEPTLRIQPLDPLATIWLAVRTRGVDRVVQATLDRLGTTVLKLHHQSQVERFGFAPDELSVVNSLRARPCPVSALLSDGLIPAPSIKLVIYALLITRHIDHGSAPPVGIARSSERDGPRPEADPAPPSHIPIARVKLASRRAGFDERPASSSKMVAALPPELVARREAILKCAEEIDRQDYFAMLGVGKEATLAEVEASYYAMVKTWHPDRVPPELANLRDAASKVFARISEAFQTLSDPVMRKRYLNVLKGGAGTPEEADKVRQIVNTAGDFQRGEILWKNRDPNAEKFIVRAYEAEPQQSDYAALYATLELSKRPADAPVDDLVKLCDQAIETNERCERAYFCRAQLKKRLGKIEGSIADFRRAFDLNPKNLDAGREVRLYEMRRAKQPERRSNPAPRRSTAPGKGSNPPRLSSKPPIKNTESDRASKKEGVFSGIGKLFKR